MDLQAYARLTLLCKALEHPDRHQFVTRVVLEILLTIRRQALHFQTAIRLTTEAITSEFVPQSCVSKALLSRRNRGRWNYSQRSTRRTGLSNGVLNYTASGPNSRLSGALLKQLLRPTNLAKLLSGVSASCELLLKQDTLCAHKAWYPCGKDNFSKCWR